MAPAAARTGWAAAGTMGRTASTAVRGSTPAADVGPARASWTARTVGRTASAAGTVRRPAASVGSASPVILMPPTL